MTTDQSIHSALKNFATVKAAGDDCLIVRRSDHPHTEGDYFYAIRPADKRLWTNGESALTADEIADLWYSADCPPYSVAQRDKEARRRAVYIVTTGTVPSEEITAIGQEAASELADKTNGSYWRDW